MNSANNDMLDRYHYEEILLILFICSSDLSSYNYNHLVFFAESIEGRVDVLFKTDYLESLSSLLITNKEILADFEELRNRLINMYSKQWHNKLREGNEGRIETQKLAQKILKSINVVYIEPLTFAENHLNLF